MIINNEEFVDDYTKLPDSFLMEELDEIVLRLAGMESRDWVTSQDDMVRQYRKLKREIIARMPMYRNKNK